LEAIVSVIYSADLWDGRESYDSKAVATANNEAEAIQRAKNWAKASVSHSATNKMWLRVNVVGKMQSFAVEEL
jgi:hypothetical protein